MICYYVHRIGMNVSDSENRIGLGRVKFNHIREGTTRQRLAIRGGLLREWRDDKEMPWRDLIPRNKKKAFQLSRR